MSAAATLSDLPALYHRTVFAWLLKGCGYFGCSDTLRLSGYFWFMGVWYRIASGSWVSGIVQTRL